MHRRTARLNHVLLTLIGLVLVAAGGYLIVRHLGHLPRQSSHARLYTHYESHWLHHHSWIWWAVAVVAVVVGLVALRWLLVQPRIDRLRRLHVEHDFDQAGRTTMAADVLTDIVEDDVAELPGVNRVRVMLLGNSDAPALLLRVHANSGIDLALLKSQLADGALADARVALDDAEAPAQVQLNVTGRDRSS